MDEIEEIEELISEMLKLEASTNSTINELRKLREMLDPSEKPYKEEDRNLELICDTFLSQQ